MLLSEHQGAQSQAQCRRRPFSQFSSSMRSCRRRLSRRRHLPPLLASPPPPSLPPTMPEVYSRKRRSSSIGAAAAVGVSVVPPSSFNFCSAASVVVATPPRSPAPKRRRGFDDIPSGNSSGGLFRRLRDSLRRPFLTRSSRPRKYRLNSGLATTSTTSTISSSANKHIGGNASNDNASASSASLYQRRPQPTFWRLRGESPSPSRAATPTPVRRPPQSPLTFASSAACHRMIAAARCQQQQQQQTPLAAAGSGRPSPSHHYQQQQQQQQHHRAPLGAYNLPSQTGHASGREHQVIVPASAAQYYEPVAHSLPVQYQQQQQQQQQQQPQQMTAAGLKSSSSAGGKKSSDSSLWERQQAGDAGHNASVASGPPYYCSIAGTAIASAVCQQQQQQPLGTRSSRDRASYAHGSQEQPQQQQQPGSGATPTQGRKSRRRSNLFSRKEEQQQQAAAATATAAMSGAPISTVGSGRAIPMKQGHLYKRGSGGALSRTDWKKKYAALGEDGQLTYYASLHDYMANSHGKSIDLSRTTVKVPGQTRPTSNGLLLKTQLPQQPQPAAQSANSQHPHRRAKSSGRGGAIDSAVRTPDDDNSTASSSATSGTPAPGSGFEFVIVSLDSRTWQFEAPSQAERDDWVRCVEQGILRRLQLLGQDGYPTKNGVGASSTTSNTSPMSSSSGAPAASINTGASVRLVRDIPGNEACADCGRADPDWASINLGVLLCIECSGIHRQLGTHLSRVRSLDLDDWPANNVLVMRAIGNRLANSVWEARLTDFAGSADKPGPESLRECKEQFVRAKYERREYLPVLPYPDCPVQQQLVDAIARSDTGQVILCLAVAGSAVNRPYSQQDPRAAVHIAATLGQLPYLQLLLWYGADPAVRDAEGRTGHFYAVAAGKPDCAEFLVQAGCPPAVLSSAAASLSSSTRRRCSRTASPTSPSATVEIGL